MTDGRELAVCSKHDGWVASCWFSSDSDMLVSVSNNIKVQCTYSMLLTEQMIKRYYFIILTYQLYSILILIGWNYMLTAKTVLNNSF